jgi:hypothetical protein
MPNAHFIPRVHADRLLTLSLNMGVPFDGGGGRAAYWCQQDILPLPA